MREPSPGYWEFVSHIGTFRLVPKGGRIHVEWDGEALGTYLLATQAVTALIEGSCFSSAYGLDSSWAMVPESLFDWTFVFGGAAGS